VKGVVLFKFGGDQTIIEKYPDEINQKLVDGIKEAINGVNDVYKSTQLIKKDEFTVVASPIFLKAKEDRPKPALLVVICDVGEEAKIVSILKEKEKNELPDMNGLTALLFEEILHELRKSMSLKERLKLKEEKMW